MNLRHDLLLHRLLTPAFIVAALVSAGGCSRQQPSDPVAQAPAAPLVADGTAGGNAKAGDVLTSATTAGGVPATYRATFVNDRLERIVETRDSDTGQGRAPSGEYEFYGARLTKYAGAPPGTNTSVELEFDLNGAVTAARSDAGEVSTDTISAIRTRAQLLRSHALAQRAVRAHVEETDGG